MRISAEKMKTQTPRDSEKQIGKQDEMDVAGSNMIPAEITKLNPNNKVE